MNTNNNYQQQQPNVGPNEIWGIDFFWIKDLKCDEYEIRKVTEQIMRPKHNAKNKNLKE